MQRHRERGRPPHPDVLTPAEWSVLLLLRRGMSNREIARARGTSLDAVRYHIDNMAGKLGLDGRTALRSWGTDRRDLAGPEGRTHMTTRPSLNRARLEAQATTFLVRDVARTATWFSDALGFEIGEYLREDHTDAADGGLGEPVFGFVSRDGQRVALSKATGERAISGIRSNREFKEVVGDLYFWVAGIEALYAEVRERGAELIQDLHDRPYGMREFMVRTPDGHAITFGE